jgi:hypothetical protein
MNMRDAALAGDVSLAAAKFAKLITAITELTNEEAGVVITPRNVDIKTDIADMYAHGEVAFSVRFSDKSKALEIDARIKQLIKKANTKKGVFQVEGGIRRTPMLKTAETTKIFETLKCLGKKLDIRILEEHRWSSSDISSVEHNKMVIDGLGPLGAHNIDKTEFILRHSLFDRAALLALLIIEIAKE